MTGSSTPSASGRLAELVERAVIGWARFYTRDLDPEIARDRVDELTADLWDHRADSRWHHRRDAVIAVAILSRAIRGLPADLSWRRAELSGTPRSGVAFGAAWAARGAFRVSALIAIACLVVAVAAGARLVLRPDTATALTGSTQLSLLVGVIALQCGLALLRRSLTRAVGALWLAFGSVVALRASADTVFSISLTARGWAVPAMEPLLWIALGALALFFVIQAVSWQLDAGEAER